MFTIENIRAAESKIKTGADFPQFIKEIKEMGVKRNDVYLSNGLSIYFDDEDNAQQVSPDEYPGLTINTASSADKLAHALKIHQQGETDYFTFCKQAADAGVEKWVTDLDEMTCTYLDAEGNELVKEHIPSV
ncbi:phage envelope protein [Sphingobacteriaceae bacterium GW460-11-11-14-LB5]|nr:phage envelope protein [Sphingobacteriaceae bacterium GW460-11-11-14-LB5]